ncbi:MAG: phosphoribosylglycinamide formyltransferase [Rikenellaceae bacterium]
MELDLERVIDMGDQLNERTRLAIFASGSGSNFEAIAAACQSGEVDAEVALMVCDKPGAGVIERANRLGIETLVLSPKSFGSKAEYEQAILDRLEQCQVEFICLAGYMRILTDVILTAYPDRILNIHPSLLPAFKGINAIPQAFNYGVKYYGATIHFVNEELDGGAVVDQEAFRYDGRDIDELEAMVHTIEHQLYVRALRAVLIEINS